MEQEVEGPCNRLVQVALAPLGPVYNSLFFVSRNYALFILPRNSIEINIFFPNVVKAKNYSKRNRKNRLSVRRREEGKIFILFL